MTTELLTLSPDDSLHDARKLMSEHHVRHLPVVEEDGRLAGLVTQRDVLAASDSTLLTTPEDSSYAEEHVALSAFMTMDVHTIDEHASLRGTALYLQQHKVGCLPVVKDEKLVGIVTDTDFVAVAINLMEQIENSEFEEFDSEDDDFVDEAI